MKVAVLYANAGNGHRRAAEALAKICEQNDQIGEVRLIDALEYTNKVFEELYANLYLGAVKKAPTLWSLAFEETDQPWHMEKRRMLLHRINSLPLVKVLRKFSPDLCLCTHFMPADIVSVMLRQDKIHADLGIVVTDYYVHATWLKTYINRFYVAKEESREQLLQLGFPASRVQTLGIPIDPILEEPIDRKMLCSKHQIDPDMPVILLSAGAFGVMDREDMSQMLGGITSTCQMVIVCGRNRKLKEKIEKYVISHGVDNVEYRVLGFTDEMHEWMAIASLFIGKPGGLTVAECLACSLPMVIWEPIPGQEFFNATYLLENGAGIAPDCISTLPYRIDQLLKNPDQLDRMRQAARTLSRPDAARAIVNDAIEHLDEGIIKIQKPRVRFRDRFR